MTDRQKLVDSITRRTPSVRLDADLTDRQLAMQVIAAHGVDVEMPTGNGQRLCERADAYVVAFALQREDIERHASAADNFRANAHDRASAAKKLGQEPLPNSKEKTK